MESESSSRPTTAGYWITPKELWVADQCFIIGLNFLQSHTCLVNLKDQALAINGEEIPLKEQVATPEPTYYKLVLAEGVCLPPRSETLIPVKTKGAIADCL